MAGKKGGIVLKQNIRKKYLICITGRHSTGYRFNLREDVRIKSIFFNVNGIIISGDTLKAEVRSGFRTARTIMGGTIDVLDENESDKLRLKTAFKNKPQETKPIVVVQAIKESQQLTFI